jgi:phosphoribosylanthranilate isomerase
LDIGAMELKTKVKVSNITSLSEARYCAGMGVDFLGFRFWDTDENNYKTDFKHFTEISPWVSGPKFVIECLYEKDFAWVISQKIAAEYIQVELDYLTPAELDGYKLFILLPDVPTSEMIDKLVSYSKQDHCVLVTLEGFEKNKHHLNGFSVFMEEGKEEWQQDLGTLLDLPIDGIFVEGIEETAPGIQNYDHLSEILEKLTVNED